MKLSEIYSNNQLNISFEVFPPKNDETGEKTDALLSELKLLNKYNPKLISITYGAGGANRDKSLNLVKKIKNEIDVDIMPHFTCVNSDKKFVENYLEEIKSLNIDNILALRGDIPEGMTQTNFEFQHASELLAFIKSKTDLSVGVAGYPEIHNDCDDLITDIKYLKNKVDKGADVIFTQLFFDNSAFYNFVEKCRKLDITQPVVGGIMPVVSFNSLQKMLTMCRTKVPQKFKNELEKYKDDKPAIIQIGIDYASNQCQDLIKNGFKNLHFYTLNKSFSTAKILENII